MICECPNCSSYLKPVWATGDPVNERKESSPYTQKDLAEIEYMKRRIETLEAQIRCCNAENQLVHKENLKMEGKIREIQS